MVAHAAQGAELNEEEEGAALDFLLGAPRPVRHEIEVQYETPVGMVPLIFIVESVDMKKIDQIEQKHTEQPLGTIDRIGADLEIVVLACKALRDSTGREVALGSEEFRTVWQRGRSGEQEQVTLANTSMALESRFRDQLGLITGVVIQIKRAAGFGPDRVSQAKRMMVGAALG
jgi:hypothetical protein